MKLIILNKLFQAQYPDGKIFAHSKNGILSDETTSGLTSFDVQYKQDGKLYSFKGFKSVYSIAMKLNLIPESNLDYMTESQKAIEAMNKGDSFVSICGLHDTIKFLLNKVYDGKFIDLNAGDYTKDEYDRPQWIFNGYTIYNSFEECYTVKHPK